MLREECRGGIWWTARVVGATGECGAGSNGHKRHARVCVVVLAHCVVASE